MRQNKLTHQMLGCISVCLFVHHENTTRNIQHQCFGLGNTSWKWNKQRKLIFCSKNRLQIRSDFLRICWLGSPWLARVPLSFFRLVIVTEIMHAGWTHSPRMSYVSSRSRSAFCESCLLTANTVTKPSAVNVTNWSLNKCMSMTGAATWSIFAYRLSSLQSFG